MDDRRTALGPRQARGGGEWLISTSTNPAPLGLTIAVAFPADAGYVSVSKLPRGPKGYPLCRRCGTECPSARRTFCSSACVHEWKLRTQPAYQARHVLERDKGVCESCGLDCVQLLAELKELRKRLRVARYGESAAWLGRWFSGDQNLPEWTARVTELELPRHLRDLSRRLWEMDHRVPVAEGGGSCGLDNLRTLCWRCHKRVTAELRKRLAEARKAAANG